jgi:hypothetical protein
VILVGLFNWNDPTYKNTRGIKTNTKREDRNNSTCFLEDLEVVARTTEYFDFRKVWLVCEKQKYIQLIQFFIIL